MSIQLTNPTGRNTKAHVVTIGDREYFFSYDSCIAVRKSGAIDGHSYAARIANRWGPTTERHFNDLGCSKFEVVSEDDLTEIIEGSL